MKTDLAARLVKWEDIENFFPASAHQAVAKRLHTAVGPVKPIS